MRRASGVMWAFDLIPRWTYAALVAALAAACLHLKLDNTNLSIAVQKGNTHVAELSAAIAEDKASSAKRALELERKARKAVEVAAQRERLLTADNLNARSELDGLRAASSAYALRKRAATLAPELDYADPFPELFLQCSERYINLAAKTDGHASDVQTLVDAWPAPK